MSARYENSRHFHASPPNVSAAIECVLRDMGAKQIEWSADRRRVIAKIGVNFWSWGERLTAIVDEAGEIRVSSECSFPLQFFDWGKNAKNCRDLLECVASRLDSSAEPAVPT